MRVLYLDCGMGISGDMLMSALYELIPDQLLFLTKLAELGLDDVSIHPQSMQKCGIQGTHIEVMIHGEEEAEEAYQEHTHKHIHTHEYPHDHDELHVHAGEHSHDHVHDASLESSHTHTHHHISMAQIEETISRIHLSENIKQQALSVYKTIAEAESKVHNKPLDQIHFHEVGEKDAIVDIVGNMLLLEMLQVDAIYASPINTGFGKVRCAHGILPVPAPATAEILTGIPVYGGTIEGELCTPTGAALYRNLVQKTCTMPPMTIEKIGIGCGKKDFAAANILRAVIGTIYTDSDTASDKDFIYELDCNLDDCTAEEIAYAEEKLLEAGALDVYTTAIQMKKGRPGTKLSVLCKQEDKDRMSILLLKHTSTLGVRFTRFERMILDRENVIKQTPYGPVHVKRASGYGVTREKFEFEDLKKISDLTGKTIAQIRGEL